MMDVFELRTWKRAEIGMINGVSGLIKAALQAAGSRMEDDPKGRSILSDGTLFGVLRTAQEIAEDGHFWERVPVVFLEDGVRCTRADLKWRLETIVAKAQGKAIPPAPQEEAVVTDPILTL